MIWLAIGVTAGGCYAWKVAGLSVPMHLLERPTVKRISALIPVALLAALIGVQVFATDGSDGPTLGIDARLAGLAAAALALVLRAPFIVVVIVAAATAAVLRAMT